PATDATAACFSEAASRWYFLALTCPSAESSEKAPIRLPCARSQSAVQPRSSRQKSATSLSGSVAIKRPRRLKAGDGSSWQGESTRRAISAKQRVLSLRASDSAAQKQRSTVKSPSYRSASSISAAAFRIAALDVQLP